MLTLRRPSPADSLRWTWSTVTADDLAMTQAEVADILGRQGIDPDPETLVAIDRTTRGWAYGVRIAVAALRDTRSLPTAMRRAEWAIDEYFRSNVLATMGSDRRDVLLRTSLVDDVEVGLARALVEDREPRPPLDDHGFVEAYADGSFRCHPLLRRTLVRQLRQERTVHHVVATRTAQFFIDDGRVDQAVPVAVEAAAWSWTARHLVDSMAVPRWLLVGVPPALRSVAVLQAIGNEEPLLMAAAAVSRGWLEAVGPALRRADEAARPDPADRVSLGLLRASQAHALGDIETGQQEVRQVLAQPRRAQPRATCRGARAEPTRAVLPWRVRAVGGQPRRGPGGVRARQSSVPCPSGRCR